MARKSKKVSTLTKVVKAVKSAPSDALAYSRAASSSVTSSVASFAAKLNPFKSAPAAKKASKARSKKR